MSKGHAELGALLVTVGALWVATVWWGIYWLAFQLFQPRIEDSGPDGTCLCVDLEERKNDCGDNDY